LKKKQDQLSDAQIVASIMVILWPQQWSKSLQSDFMGSFIQ
jgi:hypothetical protein